MTKKSDKKSQYDFEELTDLIEQNWKNPDPLITRLCQYYGLKHDYYLDEYLDYLNTCFQMEYKHYGENTTLPAFHIQFKKEALHHILQQITDEVTKDPELRKKIRGK